MTTALSVLDLAPVTGNDSASVALRRTVELARLAERCGYTRYWFAEHHNMPSIASSSPELLIGHVAAVTEHIRVGAGGIMLPNHVPLQVAERFHTLEALHPGRIDLGIGRAPGTDPVTSRALRSFDAEQFPQHLAELQALSAGTLPETHPFRSVRVVPSDVPLPPIWLLGSSGASARLAGALGLGYSFASHFSRAPSAPAIRAYKESFRPSPAFPVPHAILAVSVVCAETEAEADYLARSLDLIRVRLERGEPGVYPSPEEATAYPYTPAEQAVVSTYRQLQIIGSPSSVRAQIVDRIKESDADEVMIASAIYDPAKRLRSYELVANAFGLG
jgi:luciferase family oxidoreductase group 1